MNIKQILVNLFLGFLKNELRLTTQSSSLIPDVRSQILELRSKMIYSLILSSLIIFSSIIIGNEIYKKLLTLEHGELFVGAFFSMIILTSFILLKKELKPKKIILQPETKPIDPALLLSSFLNEFKEGYKTSRDNRRIQDLTKREIEECL